MLKRLFDVVSSLLGLIILSPLFIIMAVIIVITSSGGVFYLGERVGQNGKPFKIFKFRSMIEGAESVGKWNVGDQDERITPTVGHFLRKTKINELPQLINVLIGNMSIVGPRPELKVYVDMYTEKEKRILDLRPGITDWASIVHFNQSDIFTKADDPDEAYLKYIRPLKIKLQIYYRDNNSFLSDIKIIFWTIYKIVFRSRKIPKEIAPIIDQHKKDLEKSNIHKEDFISNYF